MTDSKTAQKARRQKKYETVTNTIEKGKEKNMVWMRRDGVGNRGER
jgi:hypothetical protein